MNKESNLPEQGVIDVNYVVEVLERNINSMEKIEEKRKENITAEAKLLNLKCKIEQQQEQFKSRLSHLERHALKCWWCCWCH